MNSAIAKPAQIRTGSCPHGLPPGACPICSGAGGGGGSTKKADFSAKPGEMSWAECAAIGQMMKNQKAAKQQNELAFQGQLQNALNFQKNLEQLSSKLADFAQNFQAKSPSIFSKPLNFIINKLAIPVLNFLKNIPLSLQTKLNDLGQKFADISDKLAAVYGELKNAIEEKISTKLNEFKKKITSLFSIFEAKDKKDEEQKIDEKKRLFNLKNAIQTIQKRFTKNEKNINDKN